MKGYRKVDENYALSFISYPVGVVTVKHGNRINGMTAAWFCQISMNPPMVAVAISPERYTWELIREEEYFGISILGEGQEKICEGFGTVSGREIDKFKLIGVEPISTTFGIPIIPGSVIAVVLKRVRVEEMGDHLLVVGRVVEGWEGVNRKPLNWFRSSLV